MNLTLLIQGPLNKTSLDHLQNYKKYGVVMLSYWKHDDISILKEYDLQDVILITNDEYHDQDKDFIDHRVKQWQTTFNGLKHVDTEYVMKLRSDEYYTDFNPIIDMFLKDKNKMICSNVFFKKWNKYKFHISDHIMLCKTEFFLKGLSYLFDLIEKEIPQKYKMLHFSCEQVFASFFLKGIYGESLDMLNLFNDNQKHLMEKHFDVVDVNLLGDYHIVWNSGGKYFNLEYRYDFINVGSNDIQVKKMEDVFCL